MNIRTILPALAAACLLSTQPAMAKITEWTCVPGDLGYTITHDSNRDGRVSVEVSISEGMDPSLARTFRLSGHSSRGRYTYDQYGTRFEADRRSARLTLDGETYECDLSPDGNQDQYASEEEKKYAESGNYNDKSMHALNMPGRSLGGKLRAGPGTNYPAAGSAHENQRLKIVRNSGVSFNGYDWFEVVIDGYTAWQWGGIMCSEDHPVPGIFQVCGAGYQQDNGYKADNGYKPDNKYEGQRSNILRGQSLGGKLRSGPGMHYGDAGSLYEGQEIIIVANSHQSMNGYDWFEISVNGRKAYQWGGIMCSHDQLLPGIFQVCGQ